MLYVSHAFNWVAVNGLDYIHLGINIKSIELQTGGKNKKVEMERERGGWSLDFSFSTFSLIKHSQRQDKN